ncbi:hypothetical protein JCGZ_05919 [Jatropha curcas]|uniref:Uncharacterized protein n=1 Tax=Jatropha curcas TaxID=180498 RepID=A0A067JLP8_JATCU|nr:hypothetical protein JCGZ_05919 [Jatropha curcas]
MQCLRENLPEGNLGNLMLLPPVRCLLRGIRRCASGSTSPYLTSLDSTLTAMRGIWRLGGGGGTSLANPAPLPNSSWRWIDFGQGWLLV